LLIACFVICARGCRVKNPRFFLPAQALTPGFLARVRHTRGNDNKTAPVQKPRHYIVQDSIGAPKVLVHNAVGGAFGNFLEDN
jgi:hypothetical protein